MKSEKTKKNLKENTTRVILNIPNEIDEVYRELSSKRGITKTSMIVYAMSWFIDYSKSIDIMPKMLQLVNTLEK